MRLIYGLILLLPGCNAAKPHPETPRGTPSPGSSDEGHVHPTRTKIWRSAVTNGLERASNTAFATAPRIMSPLVRAAFASL